MSSREIATLCDKEHRNVCRDIENLNATYRQMGMLKIEQTPYTHELHAFLEVRTRFNDWIAARISEYDFVENQDFVNFTENPVKIQRGRPSQEYYITLDMAKELAMGR